MSLLITSSNQNEYDDTSIGDGITRAGSYINHMRSPLVIQPNSEIAVQSVKCSRPDQVVFTTDVNLGLYFGKEISETGNITNEPTRVVYATIPEGTYSKSAFTTQLATSLKDVYRNTFVNASDVSVSLKTNASLSTVGFEITFDQMAGTFPSASSVNQDYQPTAFINGNNYRSDLDGEGEMDFTDNFTYTTATQTLEKGDGTSSVGDLCSAVFHKFPLSSTGGRCEFDINTSDYPDGFTVGLVRGQTSNRASPDGFQAGGSPAVEFFDFAVRWGGGTENLEAYQYTEGLGVNDVEIDNVITSASMTSAGIRRIRFTRDAERMKVDLFDEASGGYVTFVIHDKFKPAGMSCDMLYPKITIDEEGDKIKFHHYTGVNNSWSPEYTTARQYGLKNEADARIIDEGIDKFTSDMTDADRTYVSLNASNGVANRVVLITAKNDRYGVGVKTGVAGYDKVNFDNIMEILGFDKAFIDENTYASVTNHNKVKFTSVEEPSINSTNSLFVRLNNLPHTSFNANKGSISKILYALPRQDATGKSYGTLYFEPPERTYIKLNNSFPITMTDISVDIVNFNEQIAYDLNGNTIVCFHIRKSAL
tara:strand:- start:5760 stop:7535 length:1776 start_codon:yes stop_codon:yes gene_type:complete